MTRPEKIPSQAGFEPGTFRSRGGRLTTRPTRRSTTGKKAKKSVKTEPTFKSQARSDQGAFPRSPALQTGDLPPQEKKRRRRKKEEEEEVCLLVGCLTSQQHASVSQGRTCSDNFTCCHTGIEAADQAFHLTQSQYTDTRPTSPNTDSITPGTWQGSHWSANS